MGEETTGPHAYTHNNVKYGPRGSLVYISSLHESSWSCGLSSVIANVQASQVALVVFDASKYADES